ncbi:S41 family peptidase [Shewanella khirikhana]|uniref:S41 family peptidase n=1 Tax=Shewanella khirikhana TaxID=1965282 RepID=UPI0030CA603E
MTASSTPAQDAGLPTFEAVLAILVIIITLSAMRLSLFLWPETPRAELLTAREMRQDLFVLSREIETHSAFLSLDQHDKLERIDAYMKALMNRYPDQIPADVFGAEVLKILNLLQDPGIATSEEAEFGRRLPVSLRAMENRWLALKDDLSPLDEEYPFVSHMDGIPIARWQEAAQAFLPGAARYSLSEQGHWLERITLLRAELGLKEREQVVLTLTSPEGQSRRQALALLPPAPQLDGPPAFSVSPMDNHSTLVTIGDLDELEHNRGHLLALEDAMNSPLLVLDLRRARGQSPALLTVLGAYDDNDSALVGFARYRASADKRNDYLGTEAYRAVGDGPLMAEDEAHTRFGQWFARSQPKRAKVDGRLALIAGPGCRQECEWVVHSAKDWQRASIIGEDTLGDLGKLHRFRLPNLKQYFFFSSSLAYARDGRLISGAGTSPDIWVAGQESFDAQGLLALIGELTKLPAVATPDTPEMTDSPNTDANSEESKAAEPNGTGTGIGTDPDADKALESKPAAEPEPATGPKSENAKQTQPLP